MFGRELHRAGGVLGDADHVDGRVGGEHAGDRPRHQRLVVRDQHRDLRGAGRRGAQTRPLGALAAHVGDGNHRTQGFGTYRSRPEPLGPNPFGPERTYAWTRWKIVSCVLK